MAQKRLAEKGRAVLRKGEGQRSNGSYYYRWSDRSGARHTIYAKTLPDLRERERELEQDQRDGLKFEAQYVTINDVYKLWKEIKRGLKNNTFENYKYVYETYVAPTFGKERLSTLKKSDVKRFYNRLADDRGLKASMIDSIHTVLHQVLEMAVEDSYLRNNPSDNALKELKKSQLYRSEKRTGLTIQQQELFLDYLKKPKSRHWYPIFAVLVGTGMRVGEATGLRWQDIDFEKGIISVNHTLVYYSHRTDGYKRGCYYNVNTPKTEAGKRQIPMLSFVREAFLMEREYQQEAGLECKVTFDGYTDFVFLNKDGFVYNQNSLNRAIKRTIRDCNDAQFEKSENPEVLLPDFSCHSLRHTFTTRMCEAGTNIKLMQDILGHQDISTTMNIYADVTKELREKELGNLEAIFSKTNSAE